MTRFAIGAAAAATICANLALSTPTQAKNLYHQVKTTKVIDIPSSALKKGPPQGYQTKETWEKTKKSSDTK
jgi:hypothetical protein